MNWVWAALEGVSPLAAVFCLAVVFIASVVRGFSGFGSSLMWVPGLSLVLPPVAVIPVTFLLELVASIHLWPSIHREADWRSLRWIWLGAAIGIPVGLGVLAAMPPDVTRTAIAVAVIAAAGLLWRGYRLAATLSGIHTAGIGATAGLLMGGVGIPGPPVFLYYLAVPVPITVCRASIIAFILGAGVMGSAFAAMQGLLDHIAVTRAVILVPVMLAGNYLGGRAFRRADPERARRWALLVLLAIGVTLLARVLFGAIAD